MGNPLHERRTAAEWSAASQVIEITENIGVFEQLSSVIEADLAALDTDKIPADWRETPVTGRLEFGYADAQRLLPSVHCRVATNAHALCQRCLEPFRLPLESEVNLLLLDMEQDVDGYGDHEVWELEEKLLRPRDIAEELLIMALPFSALHTESAACRTLSPGMEDSAEKMTTPFAALREQMAKDN
jgi:uncharacterized metal-binding protein YceD (DUF177 family)